MVSLVHDGEVEEVVLSGTDVFLSLVKPACT